MNNATNHFSSFKIINPNAAVQGASLSNENRHVPSQHARHLFLMTDCSFPYSHLQLKVVESDRRLSHVIAYLVVIINRWHGQCVSVYTYYCPNGNRTLFPGAQYLSIILREQSSSNKKVPSNAKKSLLVPFQSMYMCSLIQYLFSFFLLGNLFISSEPGLCDTKIQRHTHTYKRTHSMLYLDMESPTQWHIHVSVSFVMLCHFFLVSMVQFRLFLIYVANQ